MKVDFFRNQFVSPYNQVKKQKQTEQKPQVSFKAVEINAASINEITYGMVKQAKKQERNANDNEAKENRENLEKRIINTLSSIASLAVLLDAKSPDFDLYFHANKDVVNNDILYITISPKELKQKKNPTESNQADDLTSSDENNVSGETKSEKKGKKKKESVRVVKCIELDEVNREKIINSIRDGVKELREQILESPNANKYVLPDELEFKKKIRYKLPKEFKDLKSIEAANAKMQEERSKLHDIRMLDVNIKENEKYKRTINKIVKEGEDGQEDTGTLKKPALNLLKHLNKTIEEKKAKRDEIWNLPRADRESAERKESAKSHKASHKDKSHKSKSHKKENA